MINDNYVNFLADTRRRDDEIRIANQHRIAKAIPVKRPVFMEIFVRFYQRSLANFGDILIVLGGRLKCRYENLLAANNPGAKTDPC
jgi:hypothetical protein